MWVHTDKPSLSAPRMPPGSFAAWPDPTAGQRSLPREFQIANGEMYRITAARSPPAKLAGGPLVAVMQYILPLAI